ncbi:phenylalanine--tRNA ligase subunit alpha, partial [Acidipropionibacterium jensenii]
MSGPNTNDDPVATSALDAAQVERHVTEALAAIAQASTTAELKDVRIAHVGDHSPLALANREIGSLPPAERREVGKRVGMARGRVKQALAARTAEVAETELEASLAAEAVDVTLPVQTHPQGAMHPLTALIDMVSDVFTSMGWEVAEGPECESEWFNFDALNLGTDHPARALQDTLWIDPVSDGKCLRTATSPVQIHTLLAHGAPVRIISPGKVFRADEYDATHLPVFHQVEGLCVDKGISMAHLKGTLDHFAQAIFGDVRTRFRPHYFPFTEPSAEVDVECFVCHGES